jgi:GTPase SAR1 family protein
MGSSRICFRSQFDFPFHSPERLYTPLSPNGKGKNYIFIIVCCHALRSRNFYTPKKFQALPQNAGPDRASDALVFLVPGHISVVSHALSSLH